MHANCYFELFFHSDTTEYFQTRLLTIIMDTIISLSLIATSVTFKINNVLAICHCYGSLEVRNQQSCVSLKKHTNLLEVYHNLFLRVTCFDWQ